ncbi:DNA translocase FtsK [Liquorilactobacillus vini]|uniref:Cell division protein FtsK n=1 Tax=Liquorilactobacillus vini DSM 20605 TaxID=1133569 RepID=A0A0R2CMJ3_9LACO|nr:DNA translocase FtsK [Liquorilactobacillus vini]KRM89769.1 cell division protein FtsK [Liquorilactobacillus vini DSM 20605]
MEHYDGPAILRFKKRLPEAKRSITHKTLNQQEKNKLHNFHPSYIPPSLQNLQQPKTTPKYQQILATMVKPAESYLLFESVAMSDSAKAKENSAGKNASVKLISAAKNVPENQQVSPQPTFVVTEAISNEQTPILKSSTTGTIHSKINTSVEAVNDRSVIHDQTDRSIVIKAKQTDKSSKDAKQAPAAVVKPAMPGSQQMDGDSTNLQLQEQPQAQPADLIDQSKIPAGAETNSKLNLPLELLPTPISATDQSMDDWVLNESETLNQTLESFHVKASVDNWTVGPTVTQFEIKLVPGVKVNKITNLSDDLKLALAAKDIRIEAPIPGKSSVGIEIPNLYSRPVMLAEILNTTTFQQAVSPLTVALGVDLFGQPRIMDLRKMPHGLIAGATGAGKSVFINSLLISLLYKTTAAQVRWLLIDPKAVELAAYHDLPQLLAPVISDPAAATASLKWVVEEMEDRYQRLAAAGVRNIESYNQQAIDHQQFSLQLPYIVVVIDELADLMMVASSDVQNYIARITQKARAAGIHLLIATQRPSVDVVTGTIKNNIPTRIAFMVSSQTDSRTILDTAGAERLLGKGDLLYLGSGSSQPIRLQGAFVGDEVDRITDYLRQHSQPNYLFDPTSLKAAVQAQEKEDDLFPQVMAYLVNEETISTSKLQRIFSIGYNRAAGLIDELEARGYISAARGSKPRKVFIKKTDLTEN